MHWAIATATATATSFNEAKERITKLKREQMAKGTCFEEVVKSNLTVHMHVFNHRRKKCMCFFACSSIVAAAVTEFIQNLEILPLSYCIFHMVRTLCVWQKKYICEKKSYWLKNTKFEDVFVSFVLLSFVLTVIFFWWWPFTRISTAFRILLIYINVQ